MSTWQSVILHCRDEDTSLFVDYTVLWHKLYLIGLWHFDKLQTNHWIGLLWGSWTSVHSGKWSQQIKQQFKSVKKLLKTVNDRGEKLPSANRKKNNTTSMFFIFVYISQHFIFLRAFLAWREISAEGARNRWMEENKSGNKTPYTKQP